MRFTVWHVPTDGSGGWTSMYQADTLADARARLAGYLEECAKPVWLYPFVVVVTEGPRQSEVATIYEHDLERPRR